MPLEGILNWWKNWNSKRVDDRMIEDAPPTPVVIVGAQGSGGELVFGANALEGPTLGGQATINTTLTAIDANQDWHTSLLLGCAKPGFSAYPYGNLTQGINRTARRFQTTLTATAGGEIVAANVGPPGLASYQACMLLTHIYSDQTDASIALTIAASAGGFTTGLGAMTIATVADTVSPDFNQGLAWLCDTDAATIQVSCAAGQAGNAQNVTFCGVYWYET